MGRRAESQTPGSGQARRLAVSGRPRAVFREGRGFRATGKGMGLGRSRTAFENPVGPGHLERSKPR
jgi:hypothetical protein